jgi:hypothetical protein
MANTFDILKESRIENNLLFLPDRQLDHKEYVQVKKQLEILGGKWTTGKNAFVFTTPVQPLIDTLIGNPDSGSRKKTQFFPTPEPVIKLMLEYAGTKAELYRMMQEEYVLEPSAGQGHIIKYLQANFPRRPIEAYELDPINRTFLEKIPEVILNQEPDFMLSHPNGKFGFIIANPPFRNNQYIDHIQHMYKHLCNHGVLVTVCSPAYQYNENMKARKFRDWLVSVGGMVYPVPAGMFRASGTEIETCILVIRK